MQRLSEQIDGFLGALRLKGYSACTVESYANDLRQLVTYFEEQGEADICVEQLTRQRMRAWLGEMLGDEKPASRARKISAVRSFVHHLLRIEAIDDSALSPEDKAKAKEHVRQVDEHLRSLEKIVDPAS